MKSSPMILALLSAATLVWAGEPTPSPTTSPTPIPASPLSPTDGAVYQVGDPILVEQEFTDGCAGGDFGIIEPYRGIALIDPLPIRGVGLAELTPETIRINVPGTYTVNRACTNAHGIGEIYSNTITVEDPCPLLDPQPTPAASGAPVPSIQAGALGGGSSYHTVITLDNSSNVLPYVRVRNLGSSDLVLIDLFPWIEFDSIIIQPVNFVPYTVVRPGHTYYVKLEAVVTNPSVFARLGMGNFVMYAKTNDPAKPLDEINVTGYALFETADDIPDDWLLSPGPPANPATPECADQNADGTVDASDVVNFILQR